MISWRIWYYIYNNYNIYWNNQHNINTKIIFKQILNIYKNVFKDFTIK